jgi:hypothetical protein
MVGKSAPLRSFRYLLFKILRFCSKTNSAAATGAQLKISRTLLIMQSERGLKWAWFHKVKPDNTRGSRWLHRLLGRCGY